MKKLSIFICATILSVTFLFAGCTNSDNNTIRLNEVTHSIFYAPLYVAINNKYFEDEGLKIELTNGGGADKSMASVLSGDADIGLMGPEACIYVVKEGAKNAPVIFGQLTKRDGSFLMSKTNDTDFSWSDLKGKEIIGGRKGGVPAMVLEYVLKKNGLKVGDQISADVDTILNLDYSFNMVAPAFEASTNAYCTMFEPTASDYEMAGKGYNIASVGQESGEIPYTAFISKKDYAKKNSEKIEKFLTAVMKGYYFIINNDLDTVANALKDSFAGTSLESIKKAIQSYKNIDAWNNTPVMNANALDKLQTIMIDAGYLDQKVEFSKLVDNSIALKVMEKLNS